MMGHVGGADFIDVWGEDPKFTGPQIQFLLSSIKDYQLTHGSTLKNVNDEKLHTVQSRPVGVSLVPSKFPRNCFEKAVELQPVFNELYARVSTDEQWLEQELGDFLQENTFANILWSIYRGVRNDYGQMPQPISLGVFRSDYMTPLVQRGHNEEEPALKQVEFNTFSCAGATHANIVADMHRHLHKIGAYGSMLGDPLQTPKDLPPNNGIRGIVEGLKFAHNAYIETSPASNMRKGILMIVQPSNTNIADERPIEYALWAQDPPIPCFRVIFGGPAMRTTSLGENGELIYTSDTCAFSPLEVSVVYLRAGLDLEEYNHDGYHCRARFEESRAVKVPSVLGHLATFKKVQERLAMPGALEHFLDEEKSALIRSTFMEMWPMDNSERGLWGQEIATSEESFGHVLKPSLEGGGNNIYNDRIPEFWEQVPVEARKNYILMKMISPLPQKAMLISFKGSWNCQTVSELGILGVCAWRVGKKTEMLYNETPGWTFKTKPETENEMSVVKGYGFFDSPRLWDVDMNWEPAKKEAK